MIGEMVVSVRTFERYVVSELKVTSFSLSRSPGARGGPGVGVVLAERTNQIIFPQRPQIILSSFSFYI